MKKVFFAFLLMVGQQTAQAQLAVMGGVTRSGGNANSFQSNMSSQKNIVENLGTSGEHTSLIMAIQSAGLIEALQKEGPFTFFAPTNDSFTKFMQGNIESSEAETKKMARLLKYHIVSGRFDASTLAKMIKESDGTATLTTFSGDSLKATKKGKKIILTDAQGKQSVIISPDLEQSNGVIHVIDKVLAL